MKAPLRNIVGALTVVALSLAAAGAVAQRQTPVPTTPDLIPYMKKGKLDTKIWGYADLSGRLVIPAQFQEVRLFGAEGLAEVKRDGKWGMIDRQGAEVIPTRFVYQVPFSDGLVGDCVDSGQPIPGLTVLGPKPGQQTPVTGQKCGFFDRQGKVVIPFEYDWIHPFREGVAPVSISRRSDVCPPVDMGRATLYGLVDTTGKLILPVEHCHIGPSEDGWIRVVYESRGLSDIRVGFVDPAGRVLLPKLPYDFAGELWREGLLPVRTGNRWGVIDRKGREIAPPRYQDVSIGAEGRIRARLDGKWGFLDATGKVVVPFAYEDAGDFTDGLACVKVGDHNGFIDRTGKLAIEPRFDLGGYLCNWPFSEGVRPIPQGGKWGYIDRSGKFVIPPQFEEAWGFSEGLAAVRKGDLWGFVDRAGSPVIPARYFRVDQGFVQGLAYVTVRVTDPCCQGIYRFSEGFISRQGREYFDPPMSGVSLNRSRATGSVQRDPE